MRKYMALVLTLFCVLGIVGCGQQGQQDITAPAQNNEEISKTDIQLENEQALQFGIVEIRDREKEESLPCDAAFEKFYEDESNEYYFSVIKSRYVIVTYNDGKTEDIVTALNAGRVAMADLDRFNIEYHIEPKAHTLEVMENTVSEVGKGTLHTAVELSDEDANILSEIINGGIWEQGTTDCLSDCVISLKGHRISYHSECGTLNKYDLAEMSTYSSKVLKNTGKSFALSEQERITVNDILKKYITLGIDSNGPIY